MMNSLPLRDQKVILILSELEVKLKEILGETLVKIILYGSYARNEQNPESDMDIMVLVDQNDCELRKYDPSIVTLSVDIAQRYDVILSIIFKSYSHFQDYLEVLPFYQNVQNEGIEIYG